MSNKKKNKKKTTSTKKKKKKKSPVQKNRIITSSGINTTVKKKKKEKITFETIKKKIKEPNIDKDKIKENIKQFGKKAKIHSLDLLTHIKKLLMIIFVFLKKATLISCKKIKEGLIFLSRKIRIISLHLCKVFLICTKNIKNFAIYQYNNIKEADIIKKILPQKKKRKKVKKTKNTTKKNRYKEIDLNDDDPNKLHYKDYEGFAKITVFFINRIKVIKFDMKKFKKKFKYGTLKDKILILMMLCLITGFSLIIAFCIYIVATAPEISNERLYKSSASVFLDVNNNEFARRGTENREKVTYDDLPEVLVDAIVSAEDSRFFQHNGVDIARFTKAVIGLSLIHI